MSRADPTWKAQPARQPPKSRPQPLLRKQVVPRTKGRMLAQQIPRTYHRLCHQQSARRNPGPHLRIPEPAQPCFQLPPSRPTCRHRFRPNLQAPTRKMLQVSHQSHRTGSDPRPKSQLQLLLRKQSGFPMARLIPRLANPLCKSQRYLLNSHLRKRRPHLNRPYREHHLPKNSATRNPGQPLPIPDLPVQPSCLWPSPKNRLRRPIKSQP